MAADYSYSFTEIAENDVEEILRYIAEDLCNPTAANKLAGHIFRSIDALTAYPEAGTAVVNEYLSDKEIRRVLVDNYTLYYKVNYDEKMIYIIRLIYGKRDFNEIAKTI